MLNNKKNPFLSNWINGNQRQNLPRSNTESPRSQSRNEKKCDKNLNKTVSQQPRTKKDCVFTIDDDVNPLDSAMQQPSDPVDSVQEMKETVNFKKEVESMDIHPGQKKKLINMQLDYLDKLDNLKKQNMILFENNEVLSSDLKSRNQEYELSQTLLQTLQKDLDHLQSELERTKNSNQESIKGKIESDTNLEEYRRKQYNTSTKLNQAEDNVKNLNSQNCKLEVELKSCQNSLIDSNNTILILEKSLELNDNNLAKKLSKYDKEFELINKQSKKICDLTDKVSSLYHLISDKQDQQIQDQQKFAHIIGNIDDRVTKLEASINKLHEGPILNVKRIIEKLDETLTTKLIDEINKSSERREMIKREQDLMSTEQKILENSFRENQQTLSEEISRMKGLREKKFEDYLPIILAIASICFSLGIMISQQLKRQ